MHVERIVISGIFIVPYMVVDHTLCAGAVLVFYKQAQKGKLMFG